MKMKKIYIKTRKTIGGDTMNILETLPVLMLGDCKKCGATKGQWTKCNIDEENNVTDCNKCLAFVCDETQVDGAVEAIKEFE